MKKKNYLNNKDILKEIHKSKNTFNSFVEKDYANYDIILDSVDKINIRIIFFIRIKIHTRIQKDF